jgi:uncharacterized protein HemX
MFRRPRSLVLFLLVALAGTFAIPDIADARSRQRRNYAEEWRQEELEDERREERERAREEYLQHQEEQQERYIEHSERSQDSRQHHRERQLDKVLDHWDGKERSYAPAASAPARKPSGTCIYGAGNKVLYQPKGVVCNHK